MDGWMDERTSAYAVRAFAAGSTIRGTLATSQHASRHQREDLYPDSVRRDAVRSARLGNARKPTRPCDSQTHSIRTDFASSVRSQSAATRDAMERKDNPRREIFIEIF